jgi:hypothetical protein
VRHIRRAANLGSSNRKILVRRFLRRERDAQPQALSKYLPQALRRVLLDQRKYLGACGKVAHQ